MFNPTYLQRSRHGIFYFRWTLPRHPDGSDSASIRLSLRTREPKQALQLAMPLSYLARIFTTRGQRSRMDYKQLRALLIEHFGRFLAEQKAKIDSDGPLSADDRTPFENTVHLSRTELDSGFISETDTDATAVEFIRRYTMDIDPADSTKFDRLKRAITQANRDYAASVLAYSDEAETFGLTAKSPEPASKAQRLSGHTLEWLVGEFWKFAKIEQRWTDKTEGEKKEHIELLYERLGSDIAIGDVTRTEAHIMRDTLVAYPVNRHKLAATRLRTY